MNKKIRFIVEKNNGALSEETFGKPGEIIFELTKENTFMDKINHKWTNCNNGFKNFNEIYNYFMLSDDYNTKFKLYNLSLKNQLIEWAKNNLIVVEMRDCSNFSNHNLSLFLYNNFIYNDGCRNNISDYTNDLKSKSNTNYDIINIYKVVEKNRGFPSHDPTLYYIYFLIINTKPLLKLVFCKIKVFFP